MGNRQTSIRTIGADQNGQMTVEWSLLLAAFGLPTIYVLAMLLAVLAGHYRTLTYVLTLPLP